VAEAHQLLLETIQDFHKDGHRNGLAFALDKLASLYVLTDKAETAARLIGWSDATRAEIGDPRPRIEQADLDRDTAAIIAKLGAASYKVAYDVGTEMTLEEAIRFALEGDVK